MGKFQLDKILSIYLASHYLTISLMADIDFAKIYLSEMMIGVLVVQKNKSFLILYILILILIS